MTTSRLDNGNDNDNRDNADDDQDNEESKGVHKAAGDENNDGVRNWR